jgi:hypothetical protein
MTTTSPTAVPISNYPGPHFFERSGDPFHANAAPDEFKSSFKQGEQQKGWMCIDWAGNPIGFVPDGTEVAETVTAEQNLETAEKVSKEFGVPIYPHKKGSIK